LRIRKSDWRLKEPKNADDLYLGRGVFCSAENSSSGRSGKPEGVDSRAFPSKPALDLD
jgi:hypothetical protein